jgi:hypothetical protein
MPEHPGPTKRSLLQRILTEGRRHWDHEGYDPDCRAQFLRAVQCKTPEMGQRVFASENGERTFCNTCKSPTCPSCGHWATVQWQRERWCAIPEGPYRAITLTMPDTLWPLFASNPRLCRKLAEIAARVIVSYARARKGVEVGVMPILHTFNGKLEFNSHVHALVTARDLQNHASQDGSNIFFDRNQLMRSWKRLVVALLRAALESGSLDSGTDDAEVERVVQQEEVRYWRVHVQGFDGKEHFLRYVGRYVKRPPIAERRIVAVANGLVRFWYKDKRLGRRETVVRTLEQFIDLWAQHVQKRYSHSARYFGSFGPRRWSQVVAAAFALMGEKQRPRPKRRRWAFGVERLSGQNPLIDHKGTRMTFVRHLAPAA